MRRSTYMRADGSEADSELNPEAGSVVEITVDDGPTIATASDATKPAGFDSVRSLPGLVICAVFFLTSTCMGYQFSYPAAPAAADARQCYHDGAPTEGGPLLVGDASSEPSKPLPYFAAKRMHPLVPNWEDHHPDLTTGRWYVRGEAYDLTSFVDAHPGGRRYLQNTVNSDVTELFEAMHVGTTARDTLARYRLPSDDAHHYTATYRGHSSTKFAALKKRIKAEFDLNDLKNPTREYTILCSATILMHVGLLGVSLAPSTSAPLAWASHGAMGVTIAWLGGFAHNGLHMYGRRTAETWAMFLSLSNNPFMWMYKHVAGHHIYTNTQFDGDKRVVTTFQELTREKGVGASWLGISLGTFWVGVSAAVFADGGTRDTAVALSALEIMLPLVLLGAALFFGCRAHGKVFVVRLLLTMAIVDVYTFTFFQASHYQEELLDGDAVHRAVDDWGEFQLATTWGWAQTQRDLFNVPWLFLNLQPAHHLFPGVHHSKLRQITPLIREHYPGLMDDHPVLPMVRSMYRILFDSACRQPAFDLAELKKVRLTAPRGELPDSVLAPISDEQHPESVKDLTDPRYVIKKLLSYHSGKEVDAETTWAMNQMLVSASAVVVVIVCAMLYAMSRRRVATSADRAIPAVEAKDRDAKLSGHALVQWVTRRLKQREFNAGLAAGVTAGP